MRKIVLTTTIASVAYLLVVLCFLFRGLVNMGPPRWQSLCMNELAEKGVDRLTISKLMAGGEAMTPSEIEVLIRKGGPATYAVLSGRKEVPDRIRRDLFFLSNPDVKLKICNDVTETVIKAELQALLDRRDRYVRLWIVIGYVVVITLCLVGCWILRCKARP